MKRKTGFFFDERCFWHSTGLHAVTLPVGGWVQPPAGGGHAESPETKRRMKNLMDVAGLTAQLQLRGAAAASEEDLRRAQFRRAADGADKRPHRAEADVKSEHRQNREQFM